MIDLTLDLADLLARAATRTAAEDEQLISVAVVDSGGHLITFRRMDGAEIAGPIVAPDKAFTAVANRITTAELATLAAPGGELAGYHAAAGGRFVCFGGGVPLWVDGRVVGGIGVSGASAVQDHAYASAAVRLWVDAGGDAR